MDTTVQLPANLSLLDQASVKIALQKLAKNITPGNLKFLAEISEKPNVNSKLESKKQMIKTFL